MIPPHSPLEASVQKICFEKQLQFIVHESPVNGDLVIHVVEGLLSHIFGPDHTGLFIYQKKERKFTAVCSPENKMQDFLEFFFQDDEICIDELLLSLKKMNSITADFLIDKI